MEDYQETRRNATQDGPQPNIRSTPSSPVSWLQSDILCPPGIGVCGMYIDRTLSGRKERRLPLIVPVRLAPLEPASAERCEKTYVDNISQHGLRVHSSHSWQLGAQAVITPATEDSPMRGEVVYCQMVNDHNFFVGFKFPDSGLPWSILQRFNGIGH